MPIPKQTGELAPAEEPWTLIRDALYDLSLQEREPGVVIAVDTWHTPISGDCHQCVAGASIARRLGGDSEKRIVAQDFPLAVRARLDALDYFRVGYVRRALRTLALAMYWQSPNADRPARLVDFAINRETEWAMPDYDYDPEGLKEDLDILSTYLEDKYKWSSATEP